MRRYKTKKFLFIFAIITACLLFFWVSPVISFMTWLNSDGAPSLRTEEVFLNIMGPNGNFINQNNILVMYPVLFILSLSFVFLSDKPIFLIRLKSRKSYIDKHIFDVGILSFIFVLLIEIINITGAIFVFGWDTVINFKLIEYSIIDYITLLLFYFRMGVVLLLVGIITNKKIAPFITIVIYLIEYFAQNFFPVLEKIWTPNKDAISVIYLLTGDMQAINIFPVLIRGVIMNCIFVLFIYYLFERKDLIEKKENDRQ